MYKEPKNSPYISNVQKELYKERAGVELGSTKQTQGPQPMVNLQVYEPTRPKEKVDTNALITSMVPNIYYPPQMGIPPPNMWTWSQTGINPLNIVKNYQINTSGPTDDHSKLSYIYEDVLPTKNISATPTTIAERLAMHNYIRAIMFSKGDGNQISLNGKGPDSLISHVKFMDLNPYNTYKFSNNPYKGLPNDFLIYRCCYPIRHEAVTSSVSCARGSMGANVRIYKLTNESYQLNSYKNGNMIEHEVWRDIAYYEYIREQVIKKNESPNFVTLYGYYLNDASNIDFDKISLIKGDDIKYEQKYLREARPSLRTLDLQNGGNNNEGSIKISDTSKFPLERAGYRPPLLQTKTVSPLNYQTKCHLGQCIDKSKPATYYQNPQAYTGKVLIAMTESPLYNLYNWASKTYQAEGVIRRMINTGYHNDKVWHSILFQMIVGLYVLQIHGIIYNNYDIENNIYIKDLNPHGNVTNYWKYKIDGIDYYVPNYGYLVLFDSSFKENEKQGTTILSFTRDKYKIAGKPYNDTIPDDEIKMRTFDQFKKTFNTNIFNQTFIDMGGCKPSPEILRFIERITDNTSKDRTYDIGDYIRNYMRHYMNNRIGTYLKEVEISNIRKNDAKDFTKGNIIIYEEAANTYKFVLYCRESKQGVIRILTKDTKSTEIIEMDVPISLLYNYSKVEPIVQNFKINESNMNEDELLETYIINKN